MCKAPARCGPTPEAQATWDDYEPPKGHPFPSFSLEAEERTPDELFAAFGARRRHLYFDRILVKVDSNRRAACYNAVYYSCHSPTAHLWSLHTRSLVLHRPLKRVAMGAQTLRKRRRSRGRGQLLEHDCTFIFMNQPFWSRMIINGGFGDQR